MSKLRVHLVTADDQLRKLCRDALIEFREIKWDLTVSALAERVECDLEIWDFESQSAWSDHASVPLQGRILFVERGNLKCVRSWLPGQRARVLLKPVHPFGLMSLLREILLSGAGDATEESRRSLAGFDIQIQEYGQSRGAAWAESVQEMLAPVTAILGYSKLLADGQLGVLTAEQKAVVQRLGQSAQRMRRLANDMFQMSMQESGAGVHPRLEIGRMEESVERAVAEVMPLAEERGLTVQSEVCPAEGTLAYDEALIGQVLANLLHNSARLAPKGGEIEVRGFPVFWERRASNVAERAPVGERRLRGVRTHNAYRIEVSDSRPGFDLRGATEVFDASSEQSSLVNCSWDGPGGVGLSVCRSIIELHEGKIFAQAGDRSCFVFVLPCKRGRVEGLQAPSTNATATVPAVAS